MNRIRYRRCPPWAASTLALGMALGSVALLAGCGRSSRSLPNAPEAQVAPLTLSIRLERLDEERFVAQVRARGGAGTGAQVHPADGAGYQFAIDPPAGGGATWTAVTGEAWSVHFERPDALHTLIVRRAGAPDVPGAQVTLALRGDNVLPYAQILSPRPTFQQPVSTTVSFNVTWTGSDPDAADGRPSGYRSRLVTGAEINPINPETITAAQVQAFFANDFATNPGAWQEHATDDTTRMVVNAPPSVRHYLAVTAVDEGGADPIYDLNRNVLQFRPTNATLGPRLTMWNEYFQRTVNLGGVNPVPVIDLPLAGGVPITFNWSGEAPVGRIMNGFRWALDIKDITDETPRLGPDDLSHWSEWSLTTTAATVGPFSPPPEGEHHVFYVMARDNFGGVSLMAAAMSVISYVPGAPLLVVDDLYGTPSSRPFRFIGAYPMEAEQDSFHFAVGGFPDEIGSPSAVSLPGMFAGFPYDTLDYRFWPYEGLPAYYKYDAVAIYTDGTSAARSGAKFTTLNPETAIRFLNSVNRANTLALFSRAGGKIWLFGDGTTTAIANGYYTRIATGGAPLPYTSGDDPLHDILRPGNFLWDICHLRSELNTAGTVQAATAGQRLQACIPYLPAFRCDSPPPVNRTCDPRIGPGAERTAIRWSDLPLLTIANYRGALADPAARSIGPPNLTWVIKQPLHVQEGGSPVADTLYLCAAKEYDPLGLATPGSDGFPNAIHYYGSENGQVVWMGFPLYFFELTQARQVAANVMEVFGIEPLPPGVKRGAGSAHTQEIAGGNPGDGTTGPPVARGP
ncbi:MAG: hypothetical protein ACREOU_05945 [Candidatus Eiseniibacteriota bacterium]